MNITELTERYASGQDVPQQEIIDRLHLADVLSDAILQPFPDSADWKDAKGRLTTLAQKVQEG